MADNLASFNFFEGKPPDFTAAILNLLRPELYVANEVVWAKGDPAATFLFLIDGQLSSTDGTESFTHICYPGSVLGDIGVLLGTKRHTSVTALTRTAEVLTITCQVRLFAL